MVCDGRQTPKSIIGNVETISISTATRVVRAEDPAQVAPPSVSPDGHVASRMSREPFPESSHAHALTVPTPLKRASYNYLQALLTPHALPSPPAKNPTPMKSCDTRLWACHLMSCDSLQSLGALLSSRLSLGMAMGIFSSGNSFPSASTRQKIFMWGFYEGLRGMFLPTPFPAGINP
jgi:hypothetical protein